MSSAPSFRKLVDAVVETQQLQKTQFSRLRASPSRQMSYVLNVQQNNGLPVNLTCTSKTPTVTQTTASRSMYDATIEFSYEFTIFNPDQDPIEVLKQDVPLLEFFILYYVAQGTNILDCNVQNQGISLFAESASTSAGGAIDQPTVELLSLSSVSTDTRDLTIDNCTYLVNLGPGLICMPMKGIMKATYVGSEADRAAVISYLTYHISKVINSPNITKNGVKQAIFLGSRVVPVPSSSASTEGQVGSSLSSRNVAMASGMSVAAVLGMFFIYVAMARRRRKKSNSVEGTSVEKRQQVLVVDSNESDILPVLETANTSNSLESKSGDEEDEAHLGDVEAPVIKDAGVPTTPYPVTAAHSISTARTASETVTCSEESLQPMDDDRPEKPTNNLTSMEIVITKRKPPSVIDILPPKPPTGPSSKAKSVNPLIAASKPLKQRRRKKKKKKKPVTRVNSRENIMEMETITEGEEETLGDNNDKEDEEGSEYSWCSTSDSDPGSREPSPVRSRGSEPSPPRSTGSGSVNNDSSFLAMNNSGGSWDSTSIGLPATTSSESIDQKPKVNRLPPPWI